MSSVEINGCELEYIDPGKGKPVLLVHGFPLSRAMWAAQVEALKDEFRIVAVNLRGFGASGKTNAFTMESLADDLAGLLDHLKIEKAVVGGLSMGGYVTLAFAEKYEGRMNGMMLVDTRADGDSEQAKENRGRLIAIAKEKGSTPVADAMLPKMILRDAHDSRPGLVDELYAMMKNTRPETIVHALGAMRDRKDRTGVL